MTPVQRLTDNVPAQIDPLQDNAQIAGALQDNRKQQPAQDAPAAPAKTRRAGRPRSQESRRAIVGAAKRMLAKAPLAALSIESIAAKAGVGKTTIYRWWPNKAAIALETLTEQKPAAAAAAPAAGQLSFPGSAAQDAVKREIESLIRQLRGQNGRVIAGIIAEGQGDSAVLDMLYEKFLKDRLDRIAAHIETGKKGGTFNAAIGTDIALDIVLGPVFMRVLSGPHGIDDQFAAAWPAQALLALRP